MSKALISVEPRSSASPHGAGPVRAAGWVIAEGPDWITASVSPDLPLLRSGTGAADLLRQNATFPPRLKWISDRAGESAVLRLDGIAVEEELSPYLSAADAVLSGASNAEARGWPGSTESAALQALCAEWAGDAGWQTSCATRDAEVHLLHLDLPGAPPVTFETDHPRGGVDLWFHYPRSVQESGEVPLDSLTLEARANLLLRLGREFRLIVPALAEDGGFSLRVSLPGLADGTRLRIAIPALYLAVKESLGEFEALADPGLAKTYLNTFASPIGGRITNPQP
jgi:hypothetical protein